MYNLLKADFYKLKRSKALYICLGIIVLLVAYIIMDFSSSAHMKEQLSPSTYHWIYMLFKEKSFLPYFIPALQAIFITMLITSEYSTGTIKDAVSLGFGRTGIYFSKLVTVSVGSIMIMLAAVLSAVITSIFTFGIYGSFTGYDCILLIRMFMLHALLYTAYGSIFLMLSYLIKNVGGAMAFNILFSLVLGSLSSVVGNGKLGRFLLLMNFSPTAVPNPETMDIGIAIGVGIFYLMLSFSIGGFTFIKQDIK